MVSIPSRLDRYAVIGHPVNHSKSPAIHAAFAAATEQAMRYGRINAPLDGFAATVLGFAAGGGHGLNVTVPFKLEAFGLADTVSERASAAGAVNTLRFDAPDGDADPEGPIHIYGDNTDGAGLVRDIEVNIGYALAGRRVLLLGAGGAARGAVLPLLAQHPAHLTIVNRSAARAVELHARFAAEALRVGCELRSGGNDVVDAPETPYDVVINATAASLADEVPVFGSAAIADKTLAYDMMYGPMPTIFMRHAAALGADVHDGLGMLVEQAAESFLLWRGVRPDSASVLAALRADMAKALHPTTSLHAAFGQSGSAR